MNKDTQLVMENYEQKYNEALERAKEFMTNKGVAPNADAFKTAKELIGTIFPELRESEDERIRKIILGQMKQWNQEALKENCKIDFEVSTKCIAWLKKQSEQKTTPKFKIGDTIHKIGEDTVFPRTIEKIEDGDYVCNNSHSFINIKFQDDYELVEQKPAWSGKYIADVFEKVGLARIAREMRNDNLTNALQDAMIELSKFTPQSIWSEEDERERERVVGLLKGWLSTFKETYYANDCKRGIAWFESLKERMKGE